jgi:hypothetical protein
MTVLLLVASELAIAMRCALCFRHHPRHFVEPLSHHKIYLSWRPPGSNDGPNAIAENFQRDLLTSMTGDIRKEALHQIDKKAGPQTWHPDSATGITMTESIRYAQDFDVLEVVEDDLLIISELDTGPSGLLVGDEKSSSRLDADVQLTYSSEDDTDSDRGIRL